MVGSPGGGAFLFPCTAVDSLLGNLQYKCFCQNSSIETNDWAAKLLGERYRDIISTSGTVSSLPGQDGSQSSGASSREPRLLFLTTDH